MNLKELTIFVVACSLLSLVGQAQEVTAIPTFDEINKSTGSASIVVSPVFLTDPKNEYSIHFTAEQYTCVKQAIQSLNEAATKEYGSIDAFSESLKAHNFIYRIKLSDMTSKETRAVYGEGKKYAHMYLQFEKIDVNSVFLQSIVENTIVTYIDPETNRIACAFSDAKQVENFLVNKYQSYNNHYKPGRGK